jgi:hypothetical protein
MVIETLKPFPPETEKSESRLPDHPDTTPDHRLEVRANFNKIERQESVPIHHQMSGYYLG